MAPEVTESGFTSLLGPGEALGVPVLPVRFVCVRCNQAVDGKGAFDPGDVARMYFVCLAECRACRHPAAAPQEAAP